MMGKLVVYVYFYLALEVFCAEWALFWRLMVVAGKVCTDDRC